VPRWPDISIYHDLLRANHKAPICEVIWWPAGWAILFTTAAKVVNVARFYRLFASHLQDDPDTLMPWTRYDQP